MPWRQYIKEGAGSSEVVVRRRARGPSGHPADSAPGTTSSVPRRPYQKASHLTDHVMSGTNIRASCSEWLDGSNILVCHFLGGCTCASW